MMMMKAKINATTEMKVAIIYKAYILLIKYTYLLLLLSVEFEQESTNYEDGSESRLYTQQQIKYMVGFSCRL